MHLNVDECGSKAKGKRGANGVVKVRVCRVKRVTKRAEVVLAQP
jgi:hypothetical protein